MIRIERVTLPPGLRALARRNEQGDLVIYVSVELDSRQQRAAVLEAVRASRRAGWRAALPIWIAAVAGIRFWLRRIQHAIRTQPAAWATGVGAVVAGAVLAAVFLTAPGGHSPLALGGTPGTTPSGQAGSGQPGGHGGPGKRQVQPVAAIPPGPGSRSPQPGQSSPGAGSSSPAPGRSHSSNPTSSSPPPGHSSSPSPHPTGSSPTIPVSHTPTPKPTHTPTPKPTPTPTPTPKPSPKPTKSKHCVIILGIKVCIGL